MTIRIVRRTVAIAILSGACASRLAAQMKVEIGATLGRYSPLGSFQPASIYSLDLPRSPSSLGGTALGGELRLWLAPRIGLALSGATVAASVGGGSTPNGFRSTVPARVTTGSAQLLVRISGDASRARVWLGAGGGAIQYGGAAYAAFDKPVSYGGILGLGSAIRIAGGLSAEAGVSSMIYHLDIRGSALNDPGLRERGTQFDMMLHTGLSYGWH